MEDLHSTTTTDVMRTKEIRVVTRIQSRLEERRFVHTAKLHHSIAGFVEERKVARPRQDVFTGQEHPKSPAFQTAGTSPPQ